jgi:pimeloyl-ACP methyl ester carboxylesterase
MCKQLDFEIVGNNTEFLIVICPALGSTYAEWKPLVSPLSETYSILLYDRSGYGKSGIGNAERSPKNMAKELNELLQNLSPYSKYVLIGHSLGGLIVEQFIRDYPTHVVGVLFIDPATTSEQTFKELLTVKQFQKSGIDKSTMIKHGIWAGRLGLLKLLRPLFKKSVPFYYYKDYDKYAIKAIIDHLSQLKTYKTMWDEYCVFQNQAFVQKELSVHPFPAIPVRLLKHDPKVVIDEIVHFGGLSPLEARKIDTIWNELMDSHYWALSTNFKLEVSINSGHYVHLTDFKLIEKHIHELLDTNTQSQNN